MEYGMVKKKRQMLVFALWFIFLFMVAGITYLSLQSGEQTKTLGSRMIMEFAKAGHGQEEVTQTLLDSVTYIIRQSGRAIAFLLIGIVGTVTMYMTCLRCNWLIRTGLTVLMLASIAYFTEKLKIYIPSRHYSFEEMMISMAAVAVGFAVVSAIIFLGKKLKGISRPKAADSYL